MDQDKRGQLCVYVGDEMIIDVIMDDKKPNPKDAKPFDADSVTTIFSSGKSVASILIAILVDKGLLSYDKPIAEYWPEFAQNGKENTTIAEMCRHEGGMHRFSEKMPMKDCTTESIKANKLGEMIANQKQHYVDKEKFPRFYHGMNRDTILNEVFRRVEPSGRTMGEYLREEIMPNFGVEIFCGMTEQEMEKHCSVEYFGMWKNFKLLMSGKEKNPICYSMGDMWKVMGDYSKMTEECKKLGWPEQVYNEEILEYDFPAPTKDPTDDMMAALSTKECLAMEQLSWNINCSARQLAKLAAFMANKGSLEGKQLLSEDAWNKMHADPKKANMNKQYENIFTQGGVSIYDKPVPNPP